MTRHTLPSTVPLRFATFLAPNMLPVYRRIVAYIGRRLGYPTRLVIGRSFAEFERAEIDVGFICGLPYVHLARSPKPAVELLAAPVLQGERYQGRPIYFSDVVVRQDSPYRTFLDLRGCSWAYNDLDSHSGYNVTRYKLVCLGETYGFFSRVVAAGFHQAAIRLVVSGHIDAAAIDSQVLAIELRDHPRLREQVQSIDALGPATIQPVVAATRLPTRLKDEMRAVIYAMGDDPSMRDALDAGYIARFVSVTDADYDDIRGMECAAEESGFLTIR